MKQKAYLACRKRFKTARYKGKVGFQMEMRSAIPAGPDVSRFSMASASAGQAIHPYTKSLLSAVPQPNPDYERKRVRIPYKHEETPEHAEVLEALPGHYVLATKEQLANWL